MTFPLVPLNWGNRNFDPSAIRQLGVDVREGFERRHARQLEADAQGVLSQFVDEVYPGATGQNYAAPLFQAAGLGQQPGGFSPTGYDRSVQRAPLPSLEGATTRTTHHAQPDPVASRVSGAFDVAGDPTAATGPSPAQVAMGGQAIDWQTYLPSIRSAESSGNDQADNPTSSAYGRYQFTSGTWNDVDRQNPQLGLTPDGRGSGEQQELAIRALTVQNARALAAAGIQPTNGALYAAHFLGAGAAPAVWNAPDGTPVEALVGADTIRANGFLRGMTAGQFRDWATRKATAQPQAGSAVSGDTPQAPPTFTSEQTDGAAVGVPQDAQSAPVGFPAAPGVQVNPNIIGGDPGMGQGASLGQGGQPAALPSRETLQRMLRNPTTRDFAAKLIQDARKGYSADAPSMVQEYAFARSQGFQGSYLDFIETRSGQQRQAPNGAILNMVGPNGETAQVRQDDPRVDQALASGWRVQEKTSPLDDPTRLATNLRKEFNMLPEVKNFGEVTFGLERMKAGLEAGRTSANDTGVGDIAIVYGYMKMLDPTSVVREGEFATAQNAGGVPERVTNAYNQVVSGQRLTDAMREEFVNGAQQQLIAQSRPYIERMEQYKGVARTMGLDEGLIFPPMPDLSLGGPSPDEIRQELLRRRGPQGPQAPLPPGVS